MTRKTDFDIVQEIESSDFIREVKSKLDEGWELHGHMLVVPFADEDEGHGLRYIQAITKDSSERLPGGFRVGRTQ